MNQSTNLSRALATLEITLAFGSLREAQAELKALRIHLATDTLSWSLDLILDRIDKEDRDGALGIVGSLEAHVLTCPWESSDYSEDSK